MVINIQGGEVALQNIAAEASKHFYGNKELNIRAKSGRANGYCVRLNDNCFEVEYASLSDFCRAITACACGEMGENARKFNRFGVMLDCARNGVPSVQGLKRFVRTLAFCGYSYLGLYLEDCIKIDNEPLFGYMRGRYSEAELKEVISYANVFGLEIVPYVQTLAHLSNIFHHWDPYYKDVRDVGDVLLVGEDRTYELIENLLKTVSRVFDCKRINLGMDEAFMLGLGKYREKHGYPDRVDLFTKHIERVLEICRRYGLKPQIWDDMYAHYSSNCNEFSVPDDLTLTYWDYMLDDIKEYEAAFARKKKLTNNLSFATGVHKWFGYAPLNYYSMGPALTAVKACDGKVDDFCVTCWGDDGAECSYNAIWYSLVVVACEVLQKPTKKATLNKISQFLTGYTNDEMLLTDLPNKVFDGNVDSIINVSKYLLFEDAFYGVSDKANNLVYVKYFAESEKELKRLANRKNEYSYVFETLYRLCSVLKHKGDLRLKLLDYYSCGNRDKIKQLCSEVYPAIIRAVERLYVAVEKQWHVDYKAFGFEVQSVRLGGLLCRLKYQKKKLEMYVSGEIDVVEELEEENLSPNPVDNKYNGAAYYNSYEQNVTYGNLGHKLFN